MFELPSLLPSDLHSNIKKDIPNSVLDHLCYLWKVSIYYMQPSLVFSVSDNVSKESLEPLNQVTSPSATIHLSHRLSRQFIELAKIHHIQLPNIISERICTSCCVLLIPSITCNIRLRKRTRHSKVNRNSSNKERLKNQIIEKCSLCNHIKKLPGLVRRKTTELSLHSMNPSSQTTVTLPHNNNTFTSPNITNRGTTSSEYNKHNNDTFTSPNITNRGTTSSEYNKHNNDSSIKSPTFISANTCSIANRKHGNYPNNRHMLENKVMSKQNTTITTNNAITTNNHSNNNKAKFSFLDNKKQSSNRRQSAPGKLITNESDYIPFQTTTTATNTNNNNHNTTNTTAITTLFNLNKGNSNKGHNNTQVSNRIDLKQGGALSRIQHHNAFNIDTANTNMHNNLMDENNQKELNLLELEELQKKKKRRHTIFGNKSES